MIESKEIAKRLYKYRIIVNQSQQRVADNTGLIQVQISNFEKGKFFPFEVFVSLVNYYKEYFDVSNLFDEKFEPINLKMGPEEKSVREDITVAKLKHLKSNIDKEFKDVINFINKD